MLQSIFGNNGKNKTGIKQTLIEFLKEKNFRYETAEDEHLFIVPLSGENGNWKMLFHINEGGEVLQIRSFCPIQIKENQKLRMAELIARINSTILLGCFLLDFEENEIVFKTVQLSVAGGFNLSILDSLFITNARSLDDYLPAITAVNSGYTEPCLVIL